MQETEFFWVTSELITLIRKQRNKLQTDKERLQEEFSAWAAKSLNTATSVGQCNF